MLFVVSYLPPISCAGFVVDVAMMLPCCCPPLTPPPPLYPGPKGAAYKVQTYFGSSLLSAVRVG